jgi:hypothetical protein
VNSTREYELSAAVISAGNAKNAVLGYVAFCWGNVLTVIISTGNNISLGTMIIRLFGSTDDLENKRC